MNMESKTDEGKKKTVEVNRLKKVLDQEGLTQVKFASLTVDFAERISSGTINKICGHQKASNRHKHIIVKALNAYLKKEKYVVSDIF